MHMQLALSWVMVRPGGAFLVCQPGPGEVERMDPRQAPLFFFRMGGTKSDILAGWAKGSGRFLPVDVDVDWGVWIMGCECGRLAAMEAAAPASQPARLHPGRKGKGKVWRKAEEPARGVPPVRRSGRAVLSSTA